MLLHDNTRKIICGKEVLGFQVTEKKHRTEKGSGTVWRYASMGV